jgi:WD40 repeat protein
MLAALLASSLACAARRGPLGGAHPTLSGAVAQVAAPTFVLQTGHSSEWLMVAFSPVSRTIVSGEEAGIIKLWDAATGRLSATLDGHMHWIQGLAFSPDGTLLASAGQEGPVQLWDPANGELRGVLRGYAGTIWSLTFSPDGSSWPRGAPTAP